MISGKGDSLETATYSKPSSRQLMLSALLITATVYGGLLLAALLLPDRMMFLPGPSSYADSPDIIKIESADGSMISARFLYNPAAEYTIIFSHGNAEDMGDLYGFMEEFRQEGFSIMAYDYSGYGTSRGRATVQAALGNAEAVYSYLVDKRKINPEKIILWGRSIGSGPSTHLAENRKIGGLVLESAFTSAFRVMIPVRLLPFDRFDNLAALKRITCPVLVIHGVEDEIIPFNHGRRLYEAVRGIRMNYWVDRAGHNNLQAIAGRSYWDTAHRFERILGKQK